MKLTKRMEQLGTETAFEVLARAHQLTLSGRNIINLGIGQPDFSTPENIIEAGRKALTDGHHGYTPANGVLELREAVAEDIFYHRNVNVHPDHIVIQPGGKPTMLYACLMFGETGAEIMYPNPGFPIYESAIKFSGAEAIPIELHEENGFSFKADDVAKRITDRTRMIIINSPANPTGGVVQTEELDKLVAHLERWPEVVVLSDEIYSRILYDDTPHTTLLKYESLRDRLILLDGWSKTYAMTGWRLGYAVWPPQCIEHVVRLCVNDHSCVNAPTQYAGIEALRGPQETVDDMCRAFQQRRNLIVSKLNSISGFSCIMPAGAFYAFPNIEGTNMSSLSLQEKLLEELGVAVIAGPSFGSFGEGYLRFSYANSIENISEAIDRIQATLGKRL